jgi:hypothetical protein
MKPEDFVTITPFVAPKPEPDIDFQDPPSEEPPDKGEPPPIGEWWGSSEPSAEPSKPRPIKFTPTPFTWRDPSTFPRRQYVYGHHYARQFLSVTAAQTKVGKSSLGLVEAVAMATGQNLLGVEPLRPMRIWYWNGEDPQEELERRVLAICLHYGVDRRLRRISFLTVDATLKS